jgi:DNA-binding transcriptional ArsR family regulator
MAQSKTELFDSKLNDAAILFKALAHPARLAILKYLAATRVCITGDICEELPLSRTTVTQHLRELRDAGLIQGQVEGAKVNYCLQPRTIARLGKIFASFYENLNSETPPRKKSCQPPTTNH